MSCFKFFLIYCSQIIGKTLEPFDDDKLVCKKSMTFVLCIGEKEERRRQNIRERRMRREGRSNFILLDSCFWIW